MRAPATAPAPVVMSPSTVAATPEAPVPARDAELIGPAGLAFDPAGNLYISDCDFSFASIHRVDPTGMMTTFAGIGNPGFAGDGGPATSAQLFCPLGIAFGPDDALYVADHINNRIRRIDTAGIITTYAGSGAAGYNKGSFSGDGGSATEATLQEPYGVALDKIGNLFIADRDNNRIRKVGEDGTMSTLAGNGEVGYSRDGVPGSETSVEQPLGITVDAKGNVIFADSTNQRVRMIDGDGTIWTIAGTGEGEATGDGGPAQKAGLAVPENLILDSAGNLDITDGVYGGFRQIDRSGRITTVVGTSTIGDVPEDGTQVLGAPFARIGGMAKDAAGNLYVCSGTSVYRIDTNGILTRVAGKR